MSPEPEGLILQPLRDLQAEMADMRGRMAGMATRRTSAPRSTRSRADIAVDMIALQEDLGGLRRTVIEHHTSVVGRGVLISSLETRLRRVEHHPDLPPIDAR